MYHSIYIGDKNTWDDFHLVGTSRPIVSSPEVITSYVDVSGSDGTLDLTTALTGAVRYKNREGSWDFTVANWYEDWTSIHHKLSNYLHGNRFKIILEDDPNYYYYGRLSLSDWTSGKINSTVSIDYYLDPWKYERTTSLEDWLWDPFNFDTGIIREYDNIEVDGVKRITVPGSARQQIPVFTSSVDGMYVWYKDVRYPLNKGDNRHIGIVLGPEDAEFAFVGTGTVAISYHGGWL